MINTESYVSLDRHASARRAATRSAWKQSQCVASGQTTGGGSLGHYPHLARSNSAFSHSQQSSVSISSGSVSSIASSLTASGANGERRAFQISLWSFLKCFLVSRSSWEHHRAYRFEAHCFSNSPPHPPQALVPGRHQTVLVQVEFTKLLSWLECQRFRK